MAKKNEDLTDDLFMTEEPIMITINEKDKNIKGIFKGVVLTPWPLILIDDGGAIYGVTLNYTILKFLRKTRIPANSVLAIVWTGKTDLGAGRTVNHYRFEVKNLPAEYNKTLLEEFTGKRFDPATMSDDVWDQIDALKEENRTDEEPKDSSF